MPSADLLKNLPAPDPSSAPEAVKQAVSLRESLSAKQLEAVRQVLDKYLPELTAAAKATTAGITDAKPFQAVDKDAVLQSQRVLQNIDAEMAKIWVRSS